MSTQEDIMIYVGKYHEHIRGCSIHQRDIMIHVGDIMSTQEMFRTSEGYYEYLGRYHDSRGEIS